MTTKTFARGDLIRATYAGSTVDGIVLLPGSPDDATVIIRLDGQGWPLHGDEIKGVDLGPLKGRKPTGWYVEHASMKPLAKAPVEPQAPQTKALLELLRRKGSVTQVEAGGVLKGRSLTKRISELRNLGWPIRSEWKRDHTDQRYVRYHLQAA